MKQMCEAIKYIPTGKLLTVRSY